MKISIIVPVYNSAPLIKKNIEPIINECKLITDDFQVILCDDASSDQSRKVLLDIAAEHQNVRVLFNNGNMGLGFTLREMIVHCEGETVVYLDCDLPFGASIISQLIKKMGNYDIVVASRYLLRKNKISLMRKIASRGYYIFCRLLLRTAVLDIGSGAVAFRRKIFYQFKLECNGFGIHAEIFTKAAALRLKIKEIPGKIISFEKGSFSILRHGCSIMIETIQLWYLLKKNN